MYPIIFLIKSTRVENEKKIFQKSNFLGIRELKIELIDRKVIVVDGRVRQMPFRREHKLTRIFVFGRIKA